MKGDFWSRRREAVAKEAQTEEAAIIAAEDAELEAALVDWHGETPVKQVEERTYIWAAGIGGTWTLVIHYENGTSCTLDHGENWSGDIQRDELFARLD